MDYASVSKRSRLIADVVGRGFMPPWLPEHGCGEFVGERRLTVEQIGEIQQWSTEGSPQGNPAEAPAPPVSSEGWQLGRPDLLLSNSEPFELPAAGRDVYRNFVLSLPAQPTRYVRAMEFHPKNRAIHHASIRVDPTPESRLRDRHEPGPGFGGMDMPPTAETPEGHFLSWQPGRGPYITAAGSAWTIAQGADLVVQLHLKPSGKPEWIQPEIGLYFAAQPATNHLFKLLLGSKQIDIAPGDPAYIVEDHFRLPVDVQVTALNPHAHYLGKDLQGFAILPDGTRKWLIWIRHWSFFWQGDYRLKQPLSLPAGSELHMRYTYDNSDRNLENPSHPPQSVRYGPQTTDEMAELWVQVSATPAALELLRNVCSERVLQDLITASETRLHIDPNDAQAHTRLGSIQISSGLVSQGLRHLWAATNADPQLDSPHYYLGLYHRQQNQLAAARREFQKTIQLNPDAYKAYGNLGFIAEQQGHRSEAERYFKHVIEIYPQDPLATAELSALAHEPQGRPAVRP
jgi:Flp pilus assembly protein TadD